MSQLLDFFLNLEVWLSQLVLLYPIAVYLICFAIILSESAFFPIAPFLPGDGLLFTLGIMAAKGLISIWLVIPLLILAGVIGNTDGPSSLFLLRC